MKNYKMFDEYACFYDTLFLSEKYLHETDFILNVRKKLGLGKKIADFGCGTGIHLSYLAKKGYKTTGIDINKNMLRKAKLNSPRSSFFLGNMASFQLPEKQDMIISMYSAINYLTKSDIVKTFKNFYKNLKSRGVVIIDTRYSKNLPKIIRSYIDENKTLMWKFERISYDAGLFKMFYAIPSGNIFEYEAHKQYGLDPFWQKKILEKTGFTKVVIYADFSGKLLSSRSKDFKAIILAIKS